MSEFVRVTRIEGGNKNQPETYTITLVYQRLAFGKWQIVAQSYGVKSMQDMMKIVTAD